MWVQLPESEQYKNFLFGKDAAYISPKVGGDPYRLRHVHLVPLTELEDLEKWDKAHKRKSRKTSNRHLVYASDGRGNHLLIYILDEPSAHEVAAMRTPKNKDVMQGFAAVAEAFIFDGSIIA